MKELSSIRSLTTQLDLIHKEVASTAKKNVDVPPPESRFNSIVLLEKKAILEAEESLASLIQIIEQGLASIFRAMKEVGKEEKVQEIVDWFQAHESEVVELLQKKELFAEGEKNSSIEEQLGIPVEFLALMYKATLHHYTKENYDDALSAVLVCLYLNGTLYELWLTFGNILQKKERFEEALYIYQMASIFKNDDPQLYIYMTSVWIMLQNWEKANESLNEAFERCKDKEEYLEIQSYCNTLKEWLMNQK